MLVAEAPEPGVAAAADGATGQAAVVRVDTGSGLGPERKASLAAAGPHDVVLDLDGGQHAFVWAERADPGTGERTLFLGEGGWSVALPVLGRAERLARVRAAVHRHEGEADPDVRTPMPGTVVSIAVEPGQSVEPGQPLVSVEAMKMEHQLVAALAGTVQLHVAVGGLVKADQVVATVVPAEPPEPAGPPAAAGTP